jgi:hypothetical protein
MLEINIRHSLSLSYLMVSEISQPNPEGSR